MGISAEFLEEKKIIYVSPGIAAMVRRDMEMFEIFKGDMTPNPNHFLSMLIEGYYDRYVQEKRDARDRIARALRDVRLCDRERESAVEAVMAALYKPEVRKKRGQKKVKLPYKPTRMVEKQVRQIVDGGRVSLAEYIGDMLTGYCAKPFSERERIIFNNTYGMLDRYCRERRPLCLYIRREKKGYNVIPYRLAVGPEEMFNYLLCQVENASTGKPEARAFGLRRIESLCEIEGPGALDPDVERRLDKMEKLGPQYAINDDEEIRVRLTGKGLDLYRKIYFGRPAIDQARREPGDIYCYSCSGDQIYLYFRRFEPKDVEIIAPESLRERMRRFYSEGFAVYGPPGETK